MTKIVARLFILRQSFVRWLHRPPPTKTFQLSQGRHCCTCWWAYHIFRYRRIVTPRKIEIWLNWPFVCSSVMRANRHFITRIVLSLVLVDEEMPVMDGCTLTRKLKGDPRFKNIPIIMYSSLTSEENARRGIEAGVNMYVKKFDSGSLSNAIGQLLITAWLITQGRRYTSVLLMWRAFRNEFWSITSRF